MLSIANISSSSAASSYYELDDYYAKDSEEHKGLSGWFGRGAKELGLSGRVEPDAFKAMLEGKLPNGIELGRTEDGLKIHAPGIDLTFSAPKSVSIMSEVGGDKRIYEAHNKAVIVALGWVQDNAVGTRAMRDGKLSTEKVNNITVAMFRHDTSRNMDPQLHTHCVLSNAVLRGDKAWRSADFSEIFDNKMFTGQVYRTELAKGIAELGYTIVPTHKDGRFEIKEVPAELVGAFSSRSKEIREALKNYEFVNAKTAENAALRTRFSKKQMDREVLGEKWKEISLGLGFNATEVAKSVASGNNIPVKEKEEQQEKPQASFITRQLEAFTRLMGREEGDKSYDHISNYKWDSKDKSPVNVKAVKYALSNLAERESVFSKQDIYQQAMSFGLGKVGMKDLDKAINKLTASGFILPSKHRGKDFITTVDALQREKSTIGYMAMGQGRTNAVYSADRADELLESTSLNTSQKAAAKHILTSRDRVVGIQGYAGVGKTYMLGAANALAAKQGYKIIGMAPSASAADTLQQDSGIESGTIHKFLFKYDGVINNRGTEQGRRTMRNELKKTILVLDESSLASTRQMEGLLKLATILETKVVLVGDIKQLGAVEAGKPFAQLQQHNMAVAVMGDIFRQKTQELKEAVIHSLEGNVYKALDKLKNNITESADVAKTAAQMWLNHKDRDKTLVLAPANATRQAINEEIRNSLKLEGVIKPATEINFIKLDSKNHTQAEKTLATNYDKGDVVLFNRAYSALGIDKSEYLRVDSVDKEKQVVSLINKMGGTLKWQPSEMSGNVAGGVEVFQEKSIGLAEGDKVVWKRNSKDNGLINSHNAVVTQINAHTISFTTQSGKDLKLRRDEQIIKHIDHAYAVTTYSAQGKTSDNVIAVVESKQKNLTTQPTFYVEISRAKYEANLVVDDLKAVARQLSEATGERISAMESQGIIYEGESPFIKSAATITSLEEEYKNDNLLNNIIRSDEIIPPHLSIDTTEFSSFDDFEKIFEESLKEIPSEGRDLFKELMAKIEENKGRVIGEDLMFDLSEPDYLLEDNDKDVKIIDSLDLLDLPDIHYTTEEKSEFLAKVQELIRENSNKEKNDNITKNNNTFEDIDFDL